MNKKQKKPYMPRVMVGMNTGTRVMSSRKDKKNTRQNLKKALKDELDGRRES